MITEDDRPLRSVVNRSCNDKWWIQVEVQLLKLAVKSKLR